MHYFGPVIAHLHHIPTSNALDKSSSPKHCLSCRAQLLSSSQVSRAKKVRASQIQLCTLAMAPLRPSISPLPLGTSQWPCMTGSRQPCSSLERPPLQPPDWRIPGLKASELYLLKYSQLASRILHGTHPHAQRRHHPFLSTFFPRVRISLLAGPFFLFLPVALSNEPNLLSHRNQERTQRAHCKNPNLKPPK